MKRTVTICLNLVLLLVLSTSCTTDSEETQEAEVTVISLKDYAQETNLMEEQKDTVVKSEAEWKKELTPEQYRVAREGGTEPAFRNKYWDNKEEGIYHCVACEQPLFPSKTKFESGTGWPSFYAPLAKDKVELREDRTYGMVRTEVVCSRCASHLGHVFTDGPKPTGLRYCLNSAALDFEEE